MTVDANLSDPVITVSHSDGKVDRFKEPRVVFTDPEYFKMFNYTWIEGNDEALKNEKTVVLSESVAKKYFGDASALNKVINFNNEFDVTVTGVVKDPPVNTDLPFRIFFSSRLGANKRGWDNWGAMSSSIQCFVQLKPTTTEQEFEAKIKGWHLKYFTGPELENGKRRTYSLQPLSDVHFNTDYYNFTGRTISKLTLLTLLLIGIVLLLTACINFVNLNTVLIANRSKEAGIRKVMGSTRFQLVSQFLGETFIITILSMIISTGLVELSIMYIAPELGYKLSFDPLSDTNTMIFMVALPLVVTMLSGLYPGLSLSRFQPVRALKNKISGVPGEGMTLRRTLIIFQLVISQVLIVCTIIAVQQLNHFMAQPLGINSEGIVEFELPENKRELIHVLRDRLLAIPGVNEAAMSNTGSTGGNSWGGDAEVTVNEKIVKVNCNVKFADNHYIDTYGIKLIVGENLLDSDTVNRFLVNEAFVRALGFTNPEEAIGLHTDIWGRKAMIRGVVKDYNTLSLHNSMSPTIIFCVTDAYYVGAVKMSNSNLRETISKIKDTWESVYPKYVFEHKFLDDTIASFYNAERRNTYMIGIFAGVAIFIGCIGLFGLVSFMARSKAKEVGIRKTLGASVGQVIGLFSKEFVVLVAISFVIAAPTAWYFMEGWLENFEYRIHPGAMTFIIGVAVTIIVVLSTVGIRSYKAAAANPVDSLRDE